MDNLPIAAASDWYRVTEFDDGVKLIDEKHIVTYFRCNIWHVRGRDRDLLFDSGMGVVSLCEQLPWLRQKDVLAVASHCHFDHIGNHYEFSNRLCHCGEAHVLAKPTAHETLADKYAGIEMFTALPPGGYEQSKYEVTPAPATSLVEHGDVIDLGDRVFKVIHTPGHSPGSIALWEERTGILFSGDAVYNGPLADDNFDSDRDVYVETMRALKELPVSVVHGGHFPSFGRDRYHTIIDEYIAGQRKPGCPLE